MSFDSYIVRGKLEKTTNIHSTDSFFFGLVCELFDTRYIVKS